MASFDFGAAKQSARQSLDGFTRGQKTMLLLAGLAVVVGSVALSRWTNREDYSTLYSNLSPTDASSITQSLDSQGVRYRIGAGGNSIMVPRSDVYRTRIDLSAKGLPTDGAPGYALLDKQGLTTSEFRQRVDYQRALEGELSKTIRAINGVDAATVHLVIPQEDLFSGDARKPTASVLVRTMGQQSLTSGQVRAVVHLVASSVEGLTPEDVTVADSNGNVLAAPGEDGAAISNTRVEQTRAYEASLATSLQEMVQKVTGDGHAVVRVKAEMDYDRRTTTKETFADPATKTALVEKAAKESFTGTGGATATGVLGPNSAAAPAAAAGANASNYKKEDVQSEYAVGKVTEKVDGVPGTVTRLSIAVLLDRSRKVDAAALQKLVTAAAGLDTKRGDTIEVGQILFDTTGAKLAATQLALVSKSEHNTAMFDLIKSVLLATLALVCVFLAYRGARKSSVRQVQPIALESLARSPLVRALGEGGNGGAAMSADGGGPSEVSQQIALPPSANSRPDIAEMIERQPDEVASALREWIGDRRNP